MLVLHGLMAVAALKPQGRWADQPRVLVLHGLMAVAALKLNASGTGEEQGRKVLHGLMAVAALKLFSRSCTDLSA